MSKKTKAVIFIISAAFFFALMNTFVKLSGDLPAVQKSFFRNFIALIAAAGILKKTGLGFKPQSENIKLLIVRSITGTVGILGNFYAVGKLGLADASMIQKLSPFLAIIFSFLFLKEKVKLYQIFGVLAAFAGSIFVIKPGTDVDVFPALIGVLGACGAGSAYTAVRALGNRGEKGPVIVFFFSAFSCVVTLPYILFKYEPMTFYQVSMLLLAGLSAAGGQFSVTAAYSNAPAKEISVFDYSQVIFAAVFGFVFMGDLPDIYSVIGYVIIFGASAVMFFIGKSGNKKISRV
ncbi:MAG: DMT family transporter [Clostridiales bacterium]|nr:DMT family transporter [Clostridiales bacterium]